MNDDKDVVTLLTGWMSVADMAREHDVSPRTIYRWKQSGRVESRSFGDITLYRRCHDTPCQLGDRPDSMRSSSTDMGGVTDTAMSVDVTQIIDQLRASERELGLLRGRTEQLASELERARQHEHQASLELDATRRELEAKQASLTSLRAELLELRADNERLRRQTSPALVRLIIALMSWLKSSQR